MSSKIVEILKSETKSLKIQYVQMTEKWASSEYDRLRRWIADYRSGMFGFGEASKTYNKLPYSVVNPNGKKSDFVSKAITDAESHYENSIEKLAERIDKKKLNISNLKVSTSHIGVNINTTLTDGIKTVRAFTIIASGPVQKPHYRYLIK